MEDDPAFKADINLEMLYNMIHDLIWQTTRDRMAMNEKVKELEDKLNEVKHG